MANYTDKKNKLEYARAYILPQQYKNLYNISDGLYMGTMFEDLYKPYKKGHEKDEYKK